MRALLALLVLANLGFLALSRGWLEPYAGLSAQHQREPQRVAAQIDPEAVRVLDARLAASVTAPTLVCLQAGPFAAEQLDAAEAALRQLPSPVPTSLRVPAAPGAPGQQAQTWLRVERADATLHDRLTGLVLPGAGNGFRPCP